MNRNLQTKNKPSYKVYSFWVIIAMLTIVFIGIVVVKFVEARNIQSMNDISNLSGEQIFQQEGTYYVYIYSKVGVTDEKYELERAEELEEAIVKYLTYAKRNKEAAKLYGMIVDSGSGGLGNYGRLVNGNSNIINVSVFSDLKISRSEVPLLIKITNGRITANYKTNSNIQEELQKASNTN